MSENKNLSKITQCRSINDVNRIEDEIISCMTNIIEGHITWTLLEKEKMKTRLRQIYRDVLHHGVRVNGKSCRDARENDHTTPEMEQPDEERKKYLNEVTYPSLGNQMMETTKRRRDIPYKCAQQYGKKCRFECQILDKVKTQLEVEDLAEHEKMGEEELFTDISDTASDTREATKYISTVEERASETTAILLEL